MPSIVFTEATECVPVTDARTLMRSVLLDYSADKHGKIMCQHGVMHGGIGLVLKANGTRAWRRGTVDM
jgi:hypothetical protein